MSPHHETYHQPYLLQQFPPGDPRHVWPDVPPHFPSWETRRVELGWALELELEDAGGEDEDDVEPIHDPYAIWHPELQWASEFPLIEIN